MMHFASGVADGLDRPGEWDEEEMKNLVKISGQIEVAGDTQAYKWVGFCI